MKCDKLIKEAFEGIEFRYKLDDTLEELGNQKLSSKQLEGFLIGKGVSPKEIKQSGVLKGFENDNRVMTGKEWLERSGDQRLSTTTMGLDRAQFDTVSLGTKGADNESYKEVLTSIKSPKTNVPKEPHFIVNRQTKGDKSLLGWRRTHTDTINGSKVTVLNEVQSDWAQTERAGRGTFESNVKDTTQNIQNKIDDLDNQQLQLFDKASDAWLLENNLTLQQAFDLQEAGEIDFIDAVYRFQDINFKDDAIKTTNIFKEMNTLQARIKSTKSTKIVADFPMSEVKHTQYQIVGALDEAIKNGTNKVVIPIERDNELYGSAGVTKFYDSLNKKILPEIHKKLEKQGMRIKVGKEEYKKGDLINLDRTMMDKWESIDVMFYGKNNDKTKDALVEIQNSNWYSDFYDSPYFSYETDINKELIDRYGADFLLSDILVGLRQFYTASGTKNILHTLTIEEIPSNKVKWDVYALLGGLGLASQTKSEANTRKVNMGTNDNASEATVKQYFADIESSGGNYKAFNKGSKAYGKYQITPIMMKDLGITIRDLNTPAKQEAIMSKLIPKYQSRLEQFNLPVNKENMFVLHNLGMTGGIRVIKGNPTSEDIINMKYQLHGNTPKRTDNEIINNYAITYNLDT